MASVIKPLIQSPKFLNKGLYRRLVKKNVKANELERERRFKKQNILVISCKKSYLNHYYNQTYSKHKKFPLISEGWGNTKSKGDTFTINAFDKNPAYLPKLSEELYPFNMDYSTLSHMFDKDGYLTKEHGYNSHSLEVDAKLIAKFQMLNLKLRTILDSYGYKRPTNIQAKSIEILLQRKSALITSETGSGKTLAYVLPIINYLIENLDELNKLVIADTHHVRKELQQNVELPLIVILAPTKELCSQIAEVVRKFTDPLSLRTVLHIGGLKIDSAKDTVKNSDIQKDLDQILPLHVLVTMPAILNKLLARRRVVKMADQGDPPPTGSHPKLAYSLCAVRTVVVDEADTMLDDSFAPDTLPLLTSCQGRGTGDALSNQLILVGATRPTDLEANLGAMFSTDSFVKVAPNQERSPQISAHEGMDIPHLTSIQTARAHHVLPHVSQKFVRLIKPDKPDQLVELLSKSFVRERQSTPVSTNERSPNPPPVTMVFCQSYATVDFLRRHLKERLMGYGFYLKQQNEANPVFVPAQSTIEALHGKMDPVVRAAIFGRFFSHPSGPEVPLSFRVRVLLTTDILSRGMDTGFVGRVINYDFPKFVSDYIHRIGRVGRVSNSTTNSQPGFVINFVASKREAKLVQVIEESVRRNKPLFNVNANIKRKIVSLAEEGDGDDLD